MHFEGRLCQQNSRIPVFVRKLFVYFVIRKEIEHKNVKRQVLEPLPANGSLKKSQPIRRQMRFDCLQNLEIWLLFQGLAATHNAICEWWVEFFIAVQFVKNLRQKFQPLKWRFWMILACCVLRVACCVLRVTCCVLRVARCALRVACACCVLRVRVACCVCVLRVLRVACCVCCACCVLRLL